MNAGLRGLCALTVFVAGYVVFAAAQSGPGFPVLPPIADADPLTRHPVDVSVPARLSVRRSADRLSVSYDRASLRIVTISVGRNMAIGYRDEFTVYEDGGQRPPEPRSILIGGFSETAADIPALISKILNSGEALTGAVDGIPSAGKRYVLEHDVTLFETDVPPQHMWSPQSGRYRVLWEARVKTVG